MSRLRAEPHVGAARSIRLTRAALALGPPHFQTAAQEARKDIGTAS
jgi:hypothetical protein